MNHQIGLDLMLDLHCQSFPTWWRREAAVQKFYQRRNGNSCTGAV
jgi:hypothetical protein